MLVSACCFVTFAAVFEFLGFYTMFIFCGIWTDIDQEGCIEPDNDEPQEMGDSSIEVVHLFVTVWMRYLIKKETLIK